MKKIYTLLTILGCVGIVACEKDNYKSPDGSISGNIIDKATGEKVPQQTLNGAKVRLYQTNYSKSEPISSSVHSDGSYANDFIFAAPYKIIAEGPFFYNDTVNVNVSQNTKQDLIVTPFLRVSCQLVSKTNNSITVKVNARLGEGNTQQIARTAVVASQSASLDINNFYNVDQKGNGRILVNTESLSNIKVQDSTFTFTLQSLKPGTKYFVRGCARTINAASYYNYAPMIEVTTDN